MLYTPNAVALSEALSSGATPVTVVSSLAETWLKKENRVVAVFGVISIRVGKSERAELETKLSLGEQAPKCRYPGLKCRRGTHPLGVYTESRNDDS